MPGVLSGGEMIIVAMAVVALGVLAASSLMGIAIRLRRGISWRPRDGGRSGDE